MNAKRAVGLPVVCLSNFLMMSSMIFDVNGANSTTTTTQISVTSASAFFKTSSGQTTQGENILETALVGYTGKTPWTSTSRTLPTKSWSIISLLPSVELSRSYSTPVSQDQVVNTTENPFLPTLGISSVSINTITAPFQQDIHTSVAVVTEALSSTFNRTVSVGTTLVVPGTVSSKVSVSYSISLFQSLDTNTSEKAYISASGTVSVIQKLVSSYSTSVLTTVISTHPTSTVKVGNTSQNLISKSTLVPTIATPMVSLPTSVKTTSNYTAQFFPSLVRNTTRNSALATSRSRFLIQTLLASNRTFFEASARNSTVFSSSSDTTTTETTSPPTMLLITPSFRPSRTWSTLATSLSSRPDQRQISLSPVTVVSRTARSNENSSLSGPTVSIESKLTSVPILPHRSMTLVPSSSVGNTIKSSQLASSRRRSTITFMVSPGQTSTVPSISSNTLLPGPSLADRTTRFIQPTRSTTTVGSVPTSSAASISFSSLAFAQSTTNGTENFLVTSVSALVSKTAHTWSTSVDSYQDTVQTSKSLRTLVSRPLVANTTKILSHSTHRTIITSRTPVVYTPASRTVLTNYSTHVSSPSIRNTPLSIKVRTTFTTQISTSHGPTLNQTLSSLISLLSPSPVANTTDLFPLVTSRRITSSIASLGSNLKSVQSFVSFSSNSFSQTAVHFTDTLLIPSLRTSSTNATTDSSSTVDSPIINTTRTSPLASTTSMLSESELTLVSASSFSSVVVVYSSSTEFGTKTFQLTRSRTFSDVSMLVNSAPVSNVSSISSNPLDSYSLVFNGITPLPKSKTLIPTYRFSMSSVQASSTASISFSFDKNNTEASAVSKLKTIYRTSASAAYCHSASAETSYSLVQVSSMSTFKTIFSTSTSMVSSQNLTEEQSEFSALTSLSVRNTPSTPSTEIRKTVLSNLPSTVPEPTLSLTLSILTTLLSSTTFANTTEVLSLTKSVTVPPTIEIPSVTSAQNSGTFSSMTIIPSVANFTDPHLVSTFGTLSSIATSGLYPRVSIQTSFNSVAVASLFANTTKTSSSPRPKLASTLSASADFNLTLIPTLSIRSTTLGSPSSVRNATNISQLTRLRTISGIALLETSSVASTLPSISSYPVISEQSVANTIPHSMLPTRSTISIIPTLTGSVPTSLSILNNSSSLISPTSSRDRTETFSISDSKTPQTRKVSDSNRVTVQTYGDFSSSFANTTKTLLTSMFRTVFTTRARKTSAQNSFDVLASFSTITGQPSFRDITSTPSMTKLRTTFANEGSAHSEPSLNEGFTSSNTRLSTFSVVSTTEFSFVATSRMSPTITMSVAFNRTPEITSVISSTLVPKSVFGNITEGHSFSSLKTLTTNSTPIQTSFSCISQSCPPWKASRTETLTLSNVTLRTETTQVMSNRSSVQTSLTHLLSRTPSLSASTADIDSSLTSWTISNLASVASCSTLCKVSTGTLVPVAPSSVTMFNSFDSLPLTRTMSTTKTLPLHSSASLISGFINSLSPISPSLGSSITDILLESSSKAVNKEKTSSAFLTSVTPAYVSLRYTTQNSSVVLTTVPVNVTSVIANSTAFNMSPSFSAIGTPSLLVNSTGIFSVLTTEMLSTSRWSTMSLTSLSSTISSVTILDRSIFSSTPEISSVSILNMSSTSVILKSSEAGEWSGSTTIFSLSTTNRIGTSASSIYVKLSRIDTSGVSPSVEDGRNTYVSSKVVTMSQRKLTTVSASSSEPSSGTSYLPQSTIKVVYPSSFTITPVITSAAYISSIASWSNPSVSKISTGYGVSRSTASVSHNLITPSRSFSSLTQIGVSKVTTTNSFSVSSSNLLTPLLRSRERDISSKITFFSSIQRSSNGLETTSTTSTVPSSLTLSSRTGQRFSSCRTCSSLVLGTATLSTSSFLVSSTSTSSILDEFKIQVLLLIPVTVELNDSFQKTMERKLEDLYELGVQKSSLSRKRRALKKHLFQIPSSNAPDKLPVMEGRVVLAEISPTNARIKRQIMNVTKVKILDITRQKESQNVMVVFYITRGGELIQAARAEKLLNLPSQVETVSKLGFLVNGKFSAVDRIKDENGKKKDETVFIVLSVCVPVTFIIVSYLVIRCMKKRKSSRTIKFNQVAAQGPGSNRQGKKVSETRSDYEERYETAPTLPGKDYPDVEVEAPRSKGRSKKKPKSNSRLDKHRGEKPLDPASLFQNITRISYEGSNNVRTADEIPLRFRSAIRPDFQELGTTKITTAMQDIVRDSGVPPSWLERKQKVDLQSRSDEKVMSHEGKVGPRVQPDHGISQGQVQKVEENTDGDSDDTIQIKANIEKWRNKMRQKEKRKEKRAERRSLNQDKLIALKQRKLSRRDWLMAQPEIQAILDSDELSTASSLTRQKSRRKRWQGKGHLSGSESENEVIVMPSRRKKHQRQWRYRSKRIYPAEQRGVRLVSVRPKMPRVYAFEDPAVNTPKIRTRYSEPRLERNSGYPPISQEYETFDENEEDSVDDSDEEDYLDPFVPLYDNSVQESLPTPRYPTPTNQHVLTQNLPLRIQETALTTVPITSRPLSSGYPNTSLPEKMYFDQRHPRPSTLYPPTRKTKRSPVRNQGFYGESLVSARQPAQHPIQQVPSEGMTLSSTVKGTPTRSNATNERNLSVPRYELGVSSEGSESRTTEAELRNYNISENEAKILVARVLQRAAQKNIHLHVLK